jgi:hypothetical protein
MPLNWAGLFDTAKEVGKTLHSMATGDERCDRNKDTIKKGAGSGR